MAHPQTTEVRPVEVPILGMNWRDPLARMDPRFGEYLDNFMPETQYLKLRGGYQIHCTLPGDNDDILALGVHDNAKLYAYGSYIEDTGPSDFDHNIYNVTTSTASLEETTDTSDEAGGCYAFNLHGRIYFVSGPNALGQHDDLSRYTKGSSTWTDWTFDTTEGFVCTSYKGRIYIFSESGSEGSRAVHMDYAALGAVGGATTQVDFDEFFRQEGGVSWAGVMAGPSNRSDEQFLAFGNERGEILVYAGDYPGATNWEQVAYFKTAPPLHFNAAMEYRNDIWIPTEAGIVSLRKLFEQGSDTDEEVSVSSAINPYWNELIKNVGAADSNASMCYWPEENKVFCLMKGSLSASGTYTSTTHTMFVYNAYTGGWCIHRLANLHATKIGNLVYMNNAIYFSSAQVVMTYNPDSYKDEDYDSASTYNTYVGTIYGAYENYSSQRKYKEAVALEPLFETDFDNDKVKMSMSSDFGRKTTGEVDKAFTTDGYVRVPYNVGIKGHYLQWRMGVTADDTSTDGFKLYSMGIALK